MSFQNLGDELNDPARIYTAPNGEVLLAMLDGKPVGMVAYCRHTDIRCEMKRLYVRRQARGLHLGDALVAELIARAKRSDYEEMVLDTLAPMQAAIALYKKHGFTECEAYYRNPMDNVLYMKKML